MATTEISDNNFREVYQANDIVILDFWANWCGPCHQFAPTFEAISEKNTDLVFGKVDTEAEIKLSSYFHVRSIPTILIIRDGLEVFRHSGVLASDELQQVIDKVKTLDMAEVEKQIEAEEK